MPVWIRSWCFFLVLSLPAVADVTNVTQFACSCQIIHLHFLNATGTLSLFLSFRLTVKSSLSFKSIIHLNFWFIFFFRPFSNIQNYINKPDFSKLSSITRALLLCVVNFQKFENLFSVQIKWFTKVKHNFWIAFLYVSCTSMFEVYFSSECGVWKTKSRKYEAHASDGANHSLKWKSDLIFFHSTLSILNYYKTWANFFQLLFPLVRQFSFWVCSWITPYTRFLLFTKTHRQGQVKFETSKELFASHTRLEHKYAFFTKEK